MSFRGRRVSWRALGIAAVAVVGTSGCLAVLDLDEGKYVLRADAGPGGGDDDDDGSTHDGGHHDASFGDDSGDDDDANASADGDAADSAPPLSAEDTCDAGGWHRDCTFGEGGFATLASAVADIPVSTTDLAGNVYIVGSASAGERAATLVTISADGGIAPDASLLSSVSPVVDVRVLDDGEVALLDSNPIGGLSQATLVDAGIAVETVSTNYAIVIDPVTGMGAFVADNPVRFLSVSGTSWTAAGKMYTQQNPVFLDFDMSAQTSKLGAMGPVGLNPTGALALDSGTWFVGTATATDAGQPVDEATPGNAPAFTSATCSGPTGSAPFGDIAAVADWAVGVAPAPGGFTARFLTIDGNCPTVARYSGATDGLPKELWATRGAIVGLDSLIVVGHELGAGGDALLAAHLPISGPDAGALAPFGLTVANGVASRISLGPNVVLGRPSLSGKYLYVPYVASAPGSDAGAPLFLWVVRLVYDAP